MRANKKMRLHSGSRSGILLNQQVSKSASQQVASQATQIKLKPVRLR